MRDLVSISKSASATTQRVEIEVEYQQLLKSKWKTKYGIKMRAYIGKLG